VLAVTVVQLSGFTNETAGHAKHQPEVLERLVKRQLKLTELGATIGPETSIDR